MINISVHPSWNNFLTEEIINRLKKIEEKIGNNYTPDKNLVLRFLNVDVSNIKVVIIGQDPYFQKGVSSGRSFEVKTLNSWNEKFRQVSLKNIIRNIYKAYYNDLLPYNEIIDRKAISLAPKEWFDFLEKQGVLFLNTYFTCEIDKPNSHREIWGDFVHHIIRYIEENSNPCFFLWGNEAYRLNDIIKGKKYISNHPMMSNTKSDKDFFKSNCFVETIDSICWLK